MSHFSVFVVVPEEIVDTERTENYIEEAMENFAEDKEVPEYERKCNCVGQQAKLDSHETAVKIVGTIEDLRKSFEPIKKKLYKELGAEWKENMTKKEEDVWEKAESKADKLWRGHIKLWNIEGEKALDLHPMKGKPDNKCEYCKGTGTEKSKYNPNSKWDWYSIGGRWDGFILDKAPMKSDHYDSACESVENNICKIKDLKKEKIPFALLNGKRKWCEKGSMGWFGMASNEKDDWDSGFKKHLKMENQDDSLVCVDCHI